MVEAAVGLEPLRENVVQAKTKLMRILSQEESVSKLLEQAQQTLAYWHEQYNKYQEKKQLQLKRRFLDRELVWAEVERREAIIKTLQANFNKNQQSLGKIEDERQTIISQLDGQQAEQQALKSEVKSVFDLRLSLEREIAQNESVLSLIEQFLTEAQALESAIVNKSQLKLLRSENLKKMLLTSKKQIAKANDLVKENQTKMIRL